MPVRPLDGKTAIVTGAGRGIGRGIALALARSGARLVLAGRSRGALDETRLAIEAFGGVAMVAVCDVGEEEDVRGMVKAAVGRFDAIDILVNNAQGWGDPKRRETSPPRREITELPIAWWDNTFRTGVRATFLCCKEAFPYLSNGGGTVINFGSGAGVLGTPDLLDYSANKESIRGLSRALARAWGRHGITVNLICPVIQTDSMKAHFKERPEELEALRARTSVGWIGDAERDAGALVVFLSGDGARYLTGQTFMLDGGSIIL